MDQGPRRYYRARRSVKKNETTEAEEELEMFKFSNKREDDEQADPEAVEDGELENVTQKKKKSGQRRRKNKSKRSREAAAAEEAPVAETVAREEGSGATEQKGTAASGPSDFNYYFRKIQALDRRIASTGIRIMSIISATNDRVNESMQTERSRDAATKNNKADHLMGIQKFTDKFNTRKFGTIDTDTLQKLEAARADTKRMDDIYRQLISRTNEKFRPKNLTEEEFEGKQKFVMESNIAYNTSDKRRVDYTGERTVFGYEKNSTSQPFRRVIVEPNASATAKIFSTNDKVTDSIRYISTIFPLTDGTDSKKISLRSSIENYLHPLDDDNGQIDTIIGFLNSMSELDSRIRWTNNESSKQYKTSDFITYLCRASGDTPEFTDKQTCTIRKIEIHKKMVLTRIRDETSSTGLMVMCEEIILQLKEKNTANKETSKSYKNTETCLILTSRAQSESPGEPAGIDKPDCIHFQGMGSFSLNLDHKPINYDGILPRKDDMAVTTEWLIERMSDATSDKDEKNLAASRVFQKLIQTESVKNAASKTRINRYMARGILPPAPEITASDFPPAEQATAGDSSPAEQATAGDSSPAEQATAGDSSPAEQATAGDSSPADSKPPVVLTVDDKVSIEILQNSFLSFQRAHMILPKKSKCTTENNRTRRCTSLEYFTAPSFALIVISMTGGVKPFNYVFLKTYSIHGSARTAHLISDSKAAEPNIVPSVSKYAQPEARVGKSNINRTQSPRHLFEEVANRVRPRGGSDSPRPDDGSRASASMPPPHLHRLLFDDDDDFLLAGRSTLPDELELELELL